MKVLLVEDKREVYESFVGEFQGTSIQIAHAENAAAAIEKIETEEFDLAICDLKIPASDLVPDAHKEHGLRVFDQIRADQAGVPIIIYSAFGVLHDLGDRLADAPQHDLFGEGMVRHVVHRSKKDPRLVITEVLDFAKRLEALNEIEISPESARNYLDAYSRRLLRIYAKRHNGVLVKVQRLAGGRSGAVTVHAEIDTPQGALGGAIVAKIDSYDAVLDEDRRFHEFIGPLGATAYSALVASILAGAGNRAALFYALARKYDRSLFSVLENDSEEAANVVRKLFESTVPWHGAASDQSLALGAIRTSLLSDEALASLDAVDARLVAGVSETQKVHVHWAIGHGDLHGGNVLVDQTGTPILIDFGRLERTTAALDPITLELAAVLHPDSKVDLGGWPSDEQARNWFDLDVYLEDCPIVDFVRACREWTEHVSRGDREKDATLYSYAARQLRFADSVDVALAREFVNGAVGRLIRQE